MQFFFKPSVDVFIEVVQVLLGHGESSRAWWFRRKFIQKIIRLMRKTLRKVDECKRDCHF